jgi:hypothetical protein
MAACTAGSWKVLLVSGLDSSRRSAASTSGRSAGCGTWKQQQRTQVHYVYRRVRELHRDCPTGSYATDTRQHASSSGCVPGGTYTAGYCTGLLCSQLLHLTAARLRVRPRCHCATGVAAHLLHQLLLLRLAVAGAGQADECDERGPHQRAMDEAERAQPGHSDAACSQQPATGVAGQQAFCRGCASIAAQMACSSSVGCFYVRWWQGAGCARRCCAMCVVMQRGLRQTCAADRTQLPIHTLLLYLEAGDSS